jgi:hypothetical protein
MNKTANAALWKALADSILDAASKQNVSQFTN